jgi:DNA-directed RNA polymerase subunit RPC12/RpoP
MMTTTFWCGRCNRKLAADDRAIGQRVPCPGCGGFITVPPRAAWEAAGPPPLPPASKGSAWPPKAILVALAALAIAVLTSVFTALRPTGPALLPGDTGRLVMIDRYWELRRNLNPHDNEVAIVLCDSRSQWNRIDAAMRGTDYKTFADMLEAGEIFTADPRTRFVVVQVDPPAVQIRILDGPRTSQTGWLHAQHCAIEPAGGKP